VKRLIGALLIALILLNCTYSIKRYDEYERGAVVVLSDRVGEVIDIEEREQYGLFWGTVGFQSAFVYEIIEGGYVLEVITKDDNYVVVNRDPQGLEILREYIDRNEEVRGAKEDFEEKWKIVDYDKVGLPITQSEVSEVKGLGWIIGCGAAGSIGTILIWGAVLYMYGMVRAIAMGHDDDKINPWILIAGFPVGVYTAILAGISIEESRAINRIKVARSPRPIE
jgi:hypothetical protein